MSASVSLSKLSNSGLQLWSSELVSQISSHHAVQRVVSLGTIFALELQASDAEAGYVNYLILLCAICAIEGSGWSTSCQSPLYTYIKHFNDVQLWTCPLSCVQICVNGFQRTCGRTPS